jgi:FMN phosphatase YigB (HAD superfamily)
MNSMARKQISFLLALLPLMIPQKSPAVNIICDLGDVLFETRMARSFWNIGPLAMAYYAATLKNPLNCHKKLFDFLDTIKPRDPSEPPVKDGHNHILPQLMNDWLKGTISGAQILALVAATPGRFDNWAQESLVRALAHMIFSKEIFVSTRYLVPDGVDFLRHCKQAGHTLYILSNWDPESFIIMQQQYPDFFSLFEGIVISGDVGMVKPDPALFAYLLERYKLDPRKTFYIDDRPENIQAAQEFGIQGCLYEKKSGFLFKTHGFQEVCKKLNKWLRSDNFPISADNHRY